MKIAFLSHLDLNLYLFRLPIMKELVKNGYKVYAVCPRGEVFDRFEDFGVRAVHAPFYRGSLNPFLAIKTIFHLTKVLKEISPDIVHTFTHQPNLYGTLAAKYAGIGNIINLIEGLGSLYLSQKLSMKMVKFFVNMAYKVNFKFVKKVIFVNNDDPLYFVNKNILPINKVVVIRSVGIDTESFKPIPKDEKLLKELNLDKKIVVLMIARVLRDKGVEEYIKAANMLKDKAVFLYVGDIDKGNKNSFSPEWGSVKYLGFRRDIKELISICDIFVLPSYREGVPRTLLEASAMGKAVVTTDAVGCREVVEDNKNGFLVPIKDYKELAKKIEILINNQNLREKFGKYGRIKAEKEFDIKVVVREYMEVYEEMIKK